MSPFCSGVFKLRDLYGLCGQSLELGPVPGAPESHLCHHGRFRRFLARGPKGLLSRVRGERNAHVYVARFGFALTRFEGHDAQHADDVVLCHANKGEKFRGGGNHDLIHRRLHAEIGIGLGLSDRVDHRDGDVEGSRIRGRRDGVEFFVSGPGAAVYGRVHAGIVAVAPVPHVFAQEREVWCKHPHDGAVQQAQGRRRREPRFRQILVIGARFGQFEVVVAEGLPEEVLDEH